MASRIGIATQEGLGENIRDRISNPALKWIAIVIVIIAIFIGNTAYETGNITGGILGIQAVFDVPMIPIVIVLGILAFACMWVGSYKLVEKILTGIVIFMGLVFLITAFASPVDWGAVVAGLFTPSLPEGQAGAKGILTAVGLIGTTIVPYNLFLHASGASERFKDPEQIADARFDCVLSIGLGGIISMAIRRTCMLPASPSPMVRTWLSPCSRFWATGQRCSSASACWPPVSPAPSPLRFPLLTPSTACSAGARP